MEESWLVAGLGNPGPEYATSRHNAGFDVVDIVSDLIRATYWKSDCGSLVAYKQWEGIDVILAKPQSFMNLSGAPVAALMKKNDIGVEHLIVVHDELDIPAGDVRVKLGGGHAGHNGLRSIIDKIQTRDFPRVRIGIGRPPGRMPVVDYVLGTPRGEEAELFDVAQQSGAEAVLYLLQNGVLKTQTRFN